MPQNPGTGNWCFPLQWNMKPAEETEHAMSYLPFHIVGEDRPGRWLVTCDHAANTVPPEVNGGSLGISDADMARHIAWDPGAAGVAWALAEMLDSPAILSNFSRLVIDPNRGEDDPTLIMKLYDGTIIPANRHVPAEERIRRLDAYHRPYHRAQERLAARQPDTVLLAIHSFTQQLRGREPRPWHIGILHGKDSRLALPLLRRLRAETDLCVGENEPYGGHLDGDSVDRHAIIPGRANVLVELRNDLIRTEEQQYGWAKRLAPILEQVLQATGM
jgi:predicted N-formylglutamate amidohydrolase